MNISESFCESLDLANRTNVGPFLRQCVCSKRSLSALGLHEPPEFYEACPNKNDQTLRYGFECEEERRYWPYWRENPWTDVATLTNDISGCLNRRLVKDESKTKVRFITEANCVAMPEENRYDIISYSYRLPNVEKEETCVLRARYNDTFSGVIYQDRSEPFKILKRPANLTSSKIYNYNAIGKRGLLSQVYPAVPNTYWPPELDMSGEIVKSFSGKGSSGTFIHFQWCGFDGNDPRNNGVGLRGTDRMNIMTDDIPSGMISEENLKILENTEGPNCTLTTNPLSQLKTACQLLNHLKSPYFSHLVKLQKVEENTRWTFHCSRQLNDLVKDSGSGADSGSGIGVTSGSDIGEIHVTNIESDIQKYGLLLWITIGLFGIFTFGIVVLMILVLVRYSSPSRLK